MWFDVDAALVRAIEAHPEEAISHAPDGQRSPLAGVPPSDPIAVTPDAIANTILGRLRGCETLEQASMVLTLYRAEISNLGETAPVRKTHIENYVRYMWADASNLHDTHKKAGSK